MKKIILKILCGAICTSLLLCACTEQNTDAGANTLQTTEDATNDSESDASTEPEEESDGKITVVAVGDNLVHEAVYNDAAARARKENAKTEEGYYFDPMYDNVKHIIQNADLAIVNQESQICGKGYKASGYPAFCTPTDMGNTLMNVGFNAIVTANNHMLDMGDKGLLGTVNYWKDKPVIQVGIDLSEEDANDIAVFEQDGIKVALLAYTDVLNGSVSDSDYVGYTYYSFRTASEQIRKAKQVADIVVVSIHWGVENTFELTSDQKTIASQLTRLGADVILGHHPHVVQSVEWIQANNGNKALCVYSLGNFLSTMVNPYNMVGMILQFDLERGESGVSVQNVQVIPTVTFYTKFRDGVCIYLLEDYTRNLAARHGCNIPSSPDTFRSYITDNIAAEFLPDYLK